MKTIGVNTGVLLANAPTNGLKKRDFIFFTAKNRNTGDPETMGIWNGMVPINASVIRPRDGATVSREYQPIPDFMPPPIPASSELQVRTIRLKFSNLSQELIQAIRLYELQMAPVEIHRGVFDPATNRLADPAEVMFNGFVNKAPIRKGKQNSPGSIELELVSRARLLTITSGQKFSDEYMKTRGNDRFAQYTDVVGDIRIWWGQEVSHIEHDETVKRKFFKV